MSDHTAARITIAGSLSADLVDHFLTLLADEGLGIDYSGFDEAAIRAALDSGARLDLVANGVAGGLFDEVEQFCRENDLSYSRGDDGHYTWTPTVAFWEPGMEAPKEWTGSVDDHVPHLSVNEIAKHLSAGTLDAELKLMKRAKNMPGTFSVVPASPAP